MPLDTGYNPSWRRGWSGIGVLTAFSHSQHLSLPCSLWAREVPAEGSLHYHTGKAPGSRVPFLRGLEFHTGMGETGGMAVGERQQQEAGEGWLRIREMRRQRMFTWPPKKDPSCKPFSSSSGRHEWFWPSYNLSSLLLWCLPESLVKDLITFFPQILYLFN